MSQSFEDRRKYGSQRFHHYRYVIADNPKAAEECCLWVLRGLVAVASAAVLLPVISLGFVFVWFLKCVARSGEKDN